MTTSHQAATSQTVFLERDRRVEPLACAALIGAAVAGVVVFFPAEGRVLGPLHLGVDALLGQASFLLPLGSLFVGVLLAIRGVRPSVPLPTRRLIGVALLAVAVLPAERLLGYSTGLAGDALAGLMLESLGPALTIVATLLLICVGASLALALKRAAR